MIDLDSFTLFNPYKDWIGFLVFKKGVLASIGERVSEMKRRSLSELAKDLFEGIFDDIHDVSEDYLASLEEEYPGIGNYLFWIRKEIESATSESFRILISYNIISKHLAIPIPWWKTFYLEIQNEEIFNSFSAEAIQCLFTVYQNGYFKANTRIFDRLFSEIPIKEYSSRLIVENLIYFQLSKEDISFLRQNLASSPSKMILDIITRGENGADVLLINFPDY